MSKFEGFGPKVRDWFRGLESDNSKEYFTAHRDFFEESIRDQMKALLTELSKEFGGEIKMFRQNRDIRFSRDKSPYKTHVGIHFHQDAGVTVRVDRVREPPHRHSLAADLRGELKASALGLLFGVALSLGEGEGDA